MQYTLYKCYLGESRLRYTLHQQCSTPFKSTGGGDNPCARAGSNRPPRDVYSSGPPCLSDGTDSAREVGHRTHDMHNISFSFFFFVPRCTLPSFGLLLASLVCPFCFTTRRNFVHRTCIVQTSHGGETESTPVGSNTKAAHT